MCHGVEVNEVKHKPLKAENNPRVLLAFTAI